MSTRTRILEAAAELLAESPVADVSTRAVCEAAGVGAPALYRQFGDKEGLLTAVVDYGFEKYLAGKQAATPSEDPVRDLRDGWDAHVAFALENPSYYRLMYSPTVSGTPAAAVEAHHLLTEVVERVAAAGRLSVSVEAAAQMIMSANTGVALVLITRRELYTPDVSTRVRDAIHTAILVPEQDAVARGGEVSALSAQLRRSPPEKLTPAETGLLQEWLTRLTD
ncbi:TetR/AcrR family transcriptional regulator [Umezawaea sp. Da 62-37]|uniref:TetR/AcrR family transcriptional regulator n=1 Tax=Umezawaea sp. Da 62-37 TaxID=3075927 RepID=UPI0028F6C7AE|nr:TetR/AcrR family transcriptional regulator [Umezawaea sp. Da 62-37]WNV90428.1 TetR/AcrR family transcriptional regulator [Umezawaea sp. Da 62-37]